MGQPKRTTRTAAGATQDSEEESHTTPTATVAHEQDGDAGAVDVPKPPPKKEHTRTAAQIAQDEETDLAIRMENRGWERPKIAEYFGVACDAAFVKRLQRERKKREKAAAASGAKKENSPPKPSPRRWRPSTRSRRVSRKGAWLWRQSQPQKPPPWFEARRTL